MFTTTREYSLSIQIPVKFESCLSFLRQTLRRKGFQVLAEVPFRREFERHVGLDWQNYTVLVVWSPFLAYQALLSERDAGIFIPFHFVVAENGKTTLVAATNHGLFGQVTGRIGLQVLARHLTGKIREIFSELSAWEKLQAPNPLRAETKEVQ